jgi:hypothetical protein
MVAFTADQQRERREAKAKEFEEYGLEAVVKCQVCTTGGLVCKFMATNGSAKCGTCAGKSLVCSGGQSQEEWVGKSLLKAI